MLPLKIKVKPHYNQTVLRVYPDYIMVLLQESSPLQILRGVVELQYRLNKPSKGRLEGVIKPNGSFTLFDRKGVPVVEYNPQLNSLLRL